LFYLQILINGIMLGALYAVMAMGLTLVWGVMNFINFAHGVLIVLGAYTTFYIFQYWGLNPFLSLPLAMVLMYFVCYFLQKLLINLIVKASVFMTLIMTFGLDILLTNLAILAFTVDYRMITLPYAGSGLDIGSVTIPYLRLLALAIALALTGGLVLFMNRTKTGNAIKAVGLDKEAAQMVGVNVAKTYAITFGIGGALAAAAGALITPIFSFSPIFGDEVGLKCFVIVCLGGLGSVTGAIIGGLTLGLAEVFGSLLIGEGFKNAIAFGLLVIILIFRPQGIIGKKFFAEIKHE
jgi:branched-chain amino acid transport system permease protein